MLLEEKKIALDKLLAEFLWSALPDLDLLQNAPFSKLNLPGTLTNCDSFYLMFSSLLICVLSVYVMSKKVLKATKDLQW